MDPPYATDYTPPPHVDKIFVNSIPTLVIGTREQAALRFRYGLSLTRWSVFSSSYGKEERDWAGHL